MGSRRTRPLTIAMLLAAALVVARLWQIQVVEQRVWAEEARRLERSGAVLPYARGPILDASGAPLALDAPGYALELEYREFRRGHPLGQVAHARSAVLGAPVPLQAALADLVPWAMELVRLSPAGVLDFARGGAIEQGTLVVSAALQPFGELRQTRAADLRYYIAGLLDVGDEERGELRRIERREESRDSYLAYAARARGTTPEALLAERVVAWSDAIERLAVFAARLAEGEDADLGAPRRRDAFAEFVDELEAWRRSVEDASATALFRELYDFHPGRAAPELLLEYFDLGWLETQLGWDRARVELWARGARTGYLDGWRATWALPRVLARIRLDGGRASPDRVLSMLLAILASEGELAAALDGRPTPWRAVEHLALIDDLPRVLELDGDVPRRTRPPVLPLDPEVRARTAEPAGWALLVDAIDPRRAGELEQEFAVELDWRWNDRDLYRGSLARVLELDGHRLQAQRADRTRRVALALLDSFELTFQVALRERLETLAAHSATGLLAASEDRTDRLAERARHFAKDWSSRSIDLHGDPDYDVVYLLTRDALHYPGIRVVRRSERTKFPRGSSGEYLVPELVGTVALQDANGEIRQREKSQRFDELRREVARDEDAERELAELMQSLLRRDEPHGISGIEASFDEVLRGSNGYREELGMEDVFGRGAESVWLTPVEDGRSVQLTIVPELQLAARAVIDRPVPPPGDDQIDAHWYAEPVGAIVLLDLDGRVLAAASAPDSATVLRGDEEGERARITDRVFGASGFQPIGSVFKPFVALWALDQLGDRYDEGFVNLCAVPPGRNWAEYEGLRCHKRSGHGAVNLPLALAVSCNPYFAWLADLIGPVGVAQVGIDFGLGSPTGVLDVAGDFDVRRGLVDWPGDVFRWESGMDLGLQVRRAANGLQLVQGSPAQVAHAYLGLARGELVPLRLVEKIGGRPVPLAEATPLRYRASSLERLQSLLLAVANSHEGSAYPALSKERIGHLVVAKTGSADLESRPEDGERVRKHTWVAGWLPAEDPELVFAVYVHDTTATSSHSAVHVAEALLQAPAVQEWLSAHGHVFDATPHRVRLAPVDMGRGGLR